MLALQVCIYYSIGITVLFFQDAMFACEYHGGYIALRDQEGLYLSPIGSRAVLKTRSNVVTRVREYSATGR